MTREQLIVGIQSFRPSRYIGGLPWHRPRWLVFALYSKAVNELVDWLERQIRVPLIVDPVGGEGYCTLSAALDAATVANIIYVKSGDHSVSRRTIQAPIWCTGGSRTNLHFDTCTINHVSASP